MGAECVVVDAVADRTRLQLPNSLLTGKLTGNFAESGLARRFSRLLSAANSMLCREIPYATEQGIFGAITGNFFEEQGIFSVRAAIAEKSPIKWLSGRMEFSGATEAKVLTA